MSIEAFLALLATKIVSSAGKIKAYFRHPEEGVREASPENLVKFGKLKADGDVSISNVSINLNFLSGSDALSRADLREIVSEISKGISSHEIALGLEKDFETTFGQTTRTPLTEGQIKQIDLFRKAGWSKDKINSIRTAFRLINLEDSGKHKIASVVRESVFSGRKEVQNRKFYNLARAGYMDGFAMNLITSPLDWPDERVTRILEYFPDAVFVDQEFISQDMVRELLRRENDPVSHVTLYARGSTRIRLMEEGYNQYMSWKINQAKNNHSKEVHLFWFERKQHFMISDSEAENIELYRKAFLIKD